MTPPTLRRVEAALDSVSGRSGVIVVDGGPDHQLLAERPPLPGGAAVLIVLGGSEPATGPSRPVAPAFRVVPPLPR